MQLLTGYLSYVLIHIQIAQSTGIVEYTDCILAEV